MNFMFIREHVYLLFAGEYLDTFYGGLCAKMNLPKKMITAILLTLCCHFVYTFNEQLPIVGCLTPTPGTYLQGARGNAHK